MKTEIEQLRGKVINNVTTNTNITFNQFNKEDLSYIAHEMVRDLIKQTDLNASLQEMIRMIHFNENYPQNLNLYVENKMDSHGLCLISKWKECELTDLAKRVMKNAAEVLMEHVDDPFDKEYDDEETYRFDTFYQNYDTDPQPLIETIDTMAHHKKMVERVHPVRELQKN